MAKRGIVIRVGPVLADCLRDVWKQMERAGIAQDSGKSLRDAIINEIGNLPDRFSDRVLEAERNERRRS